MSAPQRDPMEADLLRRAQAGDEDAIGDLLRLWQPSLEAIARTLHRRHTRLGFDTHDLVATTIRRILQVGGGTVGEAAGREALGRILRSAYIDKVREEMSRRRRQAEALRAAPQRHDAPTIPAEVPAGMTADDWELVLLWKQGLSWSQIGAHLGIPHATARKRWHRLMRRLRVRRPTRSGEAASASPDDPAAPPGGDPPSDRAGDHDPPRDPPV